MTFNLGPGTARLTTEVEISVRCENLRDEDLLSKSDPTCVLFSKDNKSARWVEIGRTERILESLSPRWARKFMLQYRFEERQQLRFSVYDIDSDRERLSDHDPLGYIECSLGEIMAGQSRGFSRTFPNGGVIFVHAEEIATNNDLVTFSLEGKDLDKKDLFGKSDPFFEISRINVESNDFTIVYRSEAIQNTLSPDWRTVEIDTVRLCNSDHHRTLRFVVYDEDSDGSHDLIGSFQTTLARLLQGPGPENQYECINQKKKQKKGSKYKHSGIVSVKQIHIEKLFSFLDYISAGLQLNFTVAIDFTGSNGAPSHPSSLHYNGPAARPNQYVTAIQAVGSVIQDYDSDKMFPSLGFGAKIPPRNEVSHEFFLTLDPSNPFCAGLGGILTAYQSALNNVQLYGPTNFCPVITHVAKFAEAYQQDPSNYFVLLIITDGLITDFEETKALLKRVSGLPMSVIIVGVGDEDFSEMEDLDGDEERRKDTRDIVQFVELQKFLLPGGGWSSELLAQSVLAEVPGQVTAWMKSSGFRPGQR